MTDDFGWKAVTMIKSAHPRGMLHELANCLFGQLT
jgi:hypothetical protein